MIDVWEILNNLDYEKTFEEQKESLKKLDNINDEQVKELTKHIKSWEAGVALKYLGYEKVKNYIPELLEMLQDMNWPAAGPISELLTEIGEPVIPYIKEVFKNNDSLWHYWIVSCVIRHWDKTLLNKIKSELIELSISDSFEPGPESLIALIDKELIDKEELKELILKNENLIYTCLFVIKDSPDWKNLNLVISSLIEIQDSIINKLNDSLTINALTFFFTPDEKSLEQRFLLEKLFSFINKENLNELKITNLAKDWFYKSTISLSGFNLIALNILIEKGLVSKEDIFKIINYNKEAYRQIKEIIEKHSEELENIEKKYY